MIVDVGLLVQQERPKWGKQGAMLDLDHELVFVLSLLLARLVQEHDFQ